MLLVWLAPAAASEETVQVRRPFFDLRQQRVEYTGPGREDPPPEVREVRIGYFGPCDPAHPAAGQMWQAAQAAVAEINCDGGCSGKPIRLQTAWSDDPWGSGSSQLTKLVFRDRVWALIGGIDGSSTHLAEQIALKARLPLLSPVSSDRSGHLTNVPWIFSLTPGDHLIAPVLAREIAIELGRAKKPSCLLPPPRPVCFASQTRGRVSAQAPWEAPIRTGRLCLIEPEDAATNARASAAARDAALTIIAADDHDSRWFSARLAHALAAEAVTTRLHITFRSGQSDLAELVRKALEDGSDDASRVPLNFPASRDLRSPTAIALIADSSQSAGLVRQLRAAGYGGAIFGGPAMARHHFAQIAGGHAEGVVFPLLDHAASEEAGPGPQPGDATRQQVSAKALGNHSRWDYAAANTYDAIQLVAAAARRAGLNRARIGDALRELSPATGLGGEIRWDKQGGNCRPVLLGTIRGGLPQRLSEQHPAAGDGSVPGGSRPQVN